MMKFEKQLAKTDLNQFKAQTTQQLAKQLYYYSDCNYRFALDHINRGGKSKATIIRYLTVVRAYLLKGTWDERSHVLLDEIVKLIKDGAKKYIPADNEKSNPKVRTPKTQKPEKPQQPNKPDRFCLLSLGRIIKDFATREECSAYAEALIDIGKENTYAIKGLRFTD